MAPPRDSIVGNGARGVPGGILLHPVAVSAVALLLVNDHLLKGSALPGILTGKLSDVAGIVLLPLVLAATWEWGRHLFRRTARTGASWLPIAITAIAFTAIQVSSAAALLYGRTLGLLQWLPATVWASLSGRPAPSILVASYVPDLTDLLVLPLCLIPAWVLRRSARRYSLDCSTLGGEMNPAARVGPDKTK